MRKIFTISFLLIFTVSFSQKKVVKKIETDASDINIYTSGLDNLVLENSNSGFLEIYLYAESYDEQFIIIEDINKEINVSFNFEGIETREVIFRKFITKRLQRANAIVKIPKGKKVYIFGENVDVESKSIKNDLAIYLENGIVKLNEVKGNTILKLYSGNVYASVNKCNLNMISNHGRIKVDEAFYEKTYQNEQLQNQKKLSVTSIKANIFLTTK